VHVCPQRQADGDQKKQSTQTSRGEPGKHKQQARGQHQGLSSSWAKPPWGVLQGKDRRFPALPSTGAGGRGEGRGGPTRAWWMVISLGSWILTSCGGGAGGVSALEGGGWPGQSREPCLDSAVCHNVLQHQGKARLLFRSHGDGGGGGSSGGGASRGKQERSRDVGPVCVGGCRRAWLFTNPGRL
jgi:hypothetical protein